MSSFVANFMCQIPEKQHIEHITCSSGNTPPLLSYQHPSRGGVFTSRERIEIQTTGDRFTYQKTIQIVTHTTTGRTRQTRQM